MSIVAFDLGVLFLSKKEMIANHANLLGGPMSSGYFVGMEHLYQQLS